jgi:hypothetical protein
MTIARATDGIGYSTSRSIRIINTCHLPTGGLTTAFCRSPRTSRLFETQQAELRREDAAVHPIGLDSFRQGGGGRRDASS